MKKICPRPRAKKSNSYTVGEEKELIWYSERRTGWKNWDPRPIIARNVSYP